MHNFNEWFCAIQDLIEQRFEEDRFHEQVKHYYYRVERPKVLKAIEEFKKEMGYKPKQEKLMPGDIERAREYLFEDLIGVKRSMALCPFHSDRKPSLSVRNGFYHCFGCGAKGDTISFVMKREGMSFTEAVRWLNQH